MSSVGRGRFPSLEAIPSKLLRRPNLIPKPEVVTPSFLLGTPRAAPHEVEAMLGVGGNGHQLADEVRAAGARAQRHALHGEIGMGAQELRQYPLDLHARGMAVQRDARAASTLHVLQELALEVGMGGSSVEEGAQIGHVRPRGRGGSSTYNIDTNV